MRRVRSSCEALRPSSNVGIAASLRHPGGTQPRGPGKALTQPMVGEIPAIEVSTRIDAVCLGTLVEELGCSYRQRTFAARGAGKGRGCACVLVAEDSRKLQLLSRMRLRRSDQLPLTMTNDERRTCLSLARRASMLRSVGVRRVARTGFNRPRR